MRNQGIVQSISKRGVGVLTTLDHDGPYELLFWGIDIERSSIREGVLVNFVLNETGFGRFAENVLIGAAPAPQQDLSWGD